jgi:hypothetical protein
MKVDTKALDALLSELPEEFDEMDIANRLILRLAPASVELAALKTRLAEAVALLEESEKIYTRDNVRAFLHPQEKEK